MYCVCIIKGVFQFVLTFMPCSFPLCKRGKIGNGGRRPNDKKVVRFGESVNPGDCVKPKGRGRCVLLGKANDIGFGM